MLYGNWLKELYTYNDLSQVTEVYRPKNNGTYLIAVKQTWYTIIYLYDDGMTPMGMLYRASNNSRNEDSE